MAIPKVIEEPEEEEEEELLEGEELEGEALEDGAPVAEDSDEAGDSQRGEG